MAEAELPVRLGLLGRFSEFDPELGAADSDAVASGVSGLPARAESDEQLGRAVWTWRVSIGTKSTGIPTRRSGLLCADLMRGEFTSRKD